MRKGISSIIGLFSATTTFAQSVTNQEQHASPPTPAIDPDKLGYPVSGVEWLSREFAVFIYHLSLQLANILGPWSRTELFLHITIAKVILGLLAALIVLGVRLVARHFLNQHADHPKAEGSKRYWLGGIRFAIKKGLSIFFFVTAALLFVSPLLPHVVFATNSESPFQAVSTLATVRIFSGASGVLFSHCPPDCKLAGRSVAPGTAQMVLSCVSALRTAALLQPHNHLFSFGYRCFESGGADTSDSLKSGFDHNRAHQFDLRDSDDSSG